MKFKGTLVLTVVCLVLLAVAIFLDKPAPQDQEGEKFLFKLEATKIHRITLTRGDTVFSAKRGEGRWTIEKPWPALANKDEWNGLAMTLSTLDYDRVVAEKDAGGSAYGLSKPGLAVVFEEEKGKTYKVEFGDENPTGSFYFARRGNDPKVYLVSRYTRDKFLPDPEKLRENRATAFDALALESFDLQRPAQSLKFSRKHYNWFLETPVHARANDTEVGDLLRKCSEQKVADHLDGRDPAALKQGLGTVQFRLTLRQEKNLQEILEIGGPPPFEGLSGQAMAYNVSRDDYFTVPESFLALLQTGLDKLRSQDLAEFYPFEVKMCTVVAGGAKTVLYKGKEDNWSWKGDKGAVKLARSKVEEYLGRIRDLKAKEFVDAPADPARYGLADPAVKIILDIQDKGGLTLIFGREESGLVWARNLEYPSVCRLEAAAAKAIRPDPAAWKESAK